jgi:hypothetical protein
MSSVEELIAPLEFHGCQTFRYGDGRQVQLVDRRVEEHPLEFSLMLRHYSPSYLFYGEFSGVPGELRNRKPRMATKLVPWHRFATEYIPLDAFGDG